MMARVIVIGLGLLGALVQDAQLDLGAGPAGQDLDGLVGAHALGRSGRRSRRSGRRRGCRPHRPACPPSGRSPAAGRSPLSTPTWMPIPPNLPSICRRNCFHSLVLMNVECGSRFWSIPSRALSSSSRRDDRADVVDLDLLHGVDEQAVELEHLVLGLGPLRGLPAEQARSTRSSPGQDSSVAASASTLLIRQGPNRLTVRSARCEPGPVDPDEPHAGRRASMSKSSRSLARLASRSCAALSRDEKRLHPRRADR